jgi:hypothetical protein
MDQIYQKAETVGIRLGKSYAETARIVMILSELVKAKHQQERGLWPNVVFWRGSHILPPDDWDALCNFLSRRWFHRMWTLQEFALGKTVNIICGSSNIVFDDLHAATEFLSSHQVPIKLQYGKSGLSGAAIIDLALLQ